MNRVRDSHPMAGKTVYVYPKGHGIQLLQEGCLFTVEDWWDVVSGRSWMTANGNPAAMMYGVRGGVNGLPIDDDVVYGHVDGLGYLVHISEIGDEAKPGDRAPLG